MEMAEEEKRAKIRNKNREECGEEDKKYQNKNQVSEANARIIISRKGKENKTKEEIL
jgi:hypothetical protein